MTPSGCIDCLTKYEVIEVKHYRNWKSGIGQVISYASHYPSHDKRVHLFGHKGDTRAWKFFEMATKVCSTYGVHVSFEEVIPGGNTLVADVVATSSSENEPCGTVGTLVSGVHVHKARSYKKRAKLGTFDTSHIPLLLEMNALFVREVKKKGFDERGKGGGLKRGLGIHPP